MATWFVWPRVEFYGIGGKHAPHQMTWHCNIRFTQRCERAINRFCAESVRTRGTPHGVSDLLQYLSFDLEATSARGDQELIDTVRWYCRHDGVRGTTLEANFVSTAASAAAFGVSITATQVISMTYTDTYAPHQISSPPCNTVPCWPVLWYSES